MKIEQSKVKTDRKNRVLQKKKKKKKTLLVLIKRELIEHREKD